MRSKRAPAGAILGALAALLAGCQPTQQEDFGGGVCTEQIAAILMGRFGHTVRQVDFRWSSRKGLDSFWSMSQAVVYVHECLGYHFFEVNADEFDCARQRHLGEIPRYALYRSTSPGCEGDDSVFR